MLSLLATPVWALDFLQAYEQAQKTDPQILTAEYEYQAIEQRVPQARAALLPTVNFDAFINESSEEVSNSTLPSQPNGTQDYSVDGFTLSLQQSLYNHAYYMRLGQADMALAAAVAQRDAARQGLIIRVAQAYYNVLAAQDNVKFTQAEKEAIALQLEQSKKRFDVGLIAITDVRESQAQYDVSVAQALQAENNLANAREVLRSLIGAEPENLAPLLDEVPLLMPQPENIDEWVKTANENNLSLKAAQYSLDAAQKNTRAERAGHYPSLSLNAQYEDVSTDADTAGAYDSTTTSVGVNLNVPIYSGGLTNARTKEAVARTEQARAQRDLAQRETVRSSRDSYLGVTTSIAQVNAYKQALISTQTAHEATKAGYSVGTRTAVDVLAALREQYRAERDYAQSRYNYIINVLRLKQSAGILNREDVVQVNDWLQH